MSKWSDYIFHEKFEEDLEKFSSSLTKNDIKNFRNRFNEIERKLIKGNSSSARINACYLLEKMCEYGFHKRFTKNCLAKLIRLLELGDFQEKEAALKTLYYFKSDKRISEAVTKYILPIEIVSEKGFQVMEKQQGKFVTKLIKIAFLDNNDNYWMEHF
tara:strand:- start:144 stop:617 length:474 start_codon:yes stop_codon:yes gene_type:complete